MERLASYRDVKGIICGGDFNIDLINRSPFAENFVNIMNSFSMNPMVRRPTRVTSTTATLIDHIWCNMSQDMCASQIIQSLTTDQFFGVYGNKG